MHGAGYISYARDGAVSVFSTEKMAYKAFNKAVRSMSNDINYQHIFL